MAERRAGRRGPERWRARLAVAVALIGSSAPLQAGGDHYREIEETGVRVRAWSPWPDGLDQGYQPIFLQLENDGSVRRALEIQASNRAMRGAHHVRRSVRLDSGDRLALELAAPVSSRVSSAYLVEVRLDGHGSEAIGVVGSNEYPLFTGGTNLTRAAVLFTDAPPDAADLATWNEDLSWGSRMHGHVGRVITVHGGTPPSTPPPVNDNVRLVTAPLGDLPRRPESLTSLDLAVVDLARGAPERERADALFTWVRQGGLVAIGGADRAATVAALPGLEPWLEERFRLRSADGFEEIACGLGRALLVFGAPLATEVDRQRVRETLLDVHGWVPSLSPNRWNPVPDHPDQAWIPRPTIPSLDELPFRSFTLLLILFAALIGPLNFAFVKRLRRPVMLLVTIPVIALVSSGAVVAYGVFWQGIDVKVAVESLTVLDQRAHRATTALQRMLFAGLSPGPGLRPAAGTACLIVPDDSGRASSNLTIDDDDGTLLAGDYVPVRRRTTQVLLSDRSARGRLTVARDAEGVEVQNGLGTTLERLLVRTPDGATYLLDDALAPDESARPEPIEAAVATSLAKELWPSEAPIGREVLPPGTWLAAAASNPFGDDCGVEVHEVSGRHRLLGILPLDGVEGSR